MHINDIFITWFKIRLEIGKDIWLQFMTISYMKSYSFYMIVALSVGHEMTNLSSIPYEGIFFRDNSGRLPLVVFFLYSNWGWCQAHVFVLSWCSNMYGFYGKKEREEKKVHLLLSRQNTPRLASLKVHRYSQHQQQTCAVSHVKKSGPFQQI